MSKEVKRYEVTVLLDASSSYTVEADSVEAAEHAAWEAHGEASPSLCHQCSGPMDLGDAYGMLIYCDGNEVADTTHDAREIANLRAELDALLAERDALKREQALWEPIHYEVHRRAEKEWCLSSGCDFTVTVMHDDYAAIDAALTGAQP